MRELKRVEGQSFDIRAAAQQEEYVMGGEVIATQPQEDGRDANLEPVDMAEENGKASTGAKKKIASAKTVPAATKSARPEQKKSADKAADVKRPSTKAGPVKNQVSEPGSKNPAAAKSKPALKKAVSVAQTAPKAKPDVGRTKSLGPKEKKAAPPVAPKPAKVPEEAEPTNLTDQKSSSPSGGGKPTNGTANKSAAAKSVASSVGATKTNIPANNKEKKGLEVGGTVAPKKEGSEKKDIAAKKRPTAEKSKEPVPPRSKPTAARATSSPIEAKATGTTRKKVGTTAVAGKSGKSPTHADSDIMTQITGPDPVNTTAQAGKKTPPSVPPKPSSPNKSYISPSQSDGSIVTSPGPGHKSSLAERARLVGALEVIVST